ncbi:MAG: hypothetical protein M3Q97_02760 [Bacteroidota bacterium]|nr:hypothetical protein [Bacteroidota bacterium]
MLRYCIVVLLLLAAGQSGAQSPKYIAAYDADKYVKALKLSEKAIAKSTKDYLPYAYRVFALGKISQDPELSEKYPGSLSKALTYAAALKKRFGTKEDIFTNLGTEWADFEQNVHSTVVAMVHNGDVSKALKMAVALAELFDNAENNYLLGQVYLQNDDQHHYIQQMGLTAYFIYTAYKEGKPVVSNLPDAFLALIDYHAGQGTYDDAYTFAFRAEEIYPGNADVRIAVLNMIEPSFSNAATSNYPAEPFLSQMQNIDEACKRYPADSAIWRAKWRCHNRIASALLLARKSYQSFIRFEVFDPTFTNREMDFVLGREMIEDLLVQYTFLSFKEQSVQVLESLAGIFVIREHGTAYLAFCAPQKAKARKEKLQFLAENALETNNYELAGAIFSNLDAADKKDPILKKLQVEFDKELLASTVGTKPSYAMLLSVEQALQISPDNRELKQKSYDLYVSLAEGYIAAGDFSMATIVLREGRAKFPVDARLLALKRKLVIGDYKANFLGTEMDANESGWTGSMEKCDPGTLPQTTYALVARRMNYFRRTAGAPDQAVLRPDLNVLSQKAALIMMANGNLSHHPTANWKCYSEEGAKGAGSSNLSLGYSATGSIAGQMRDDGAGNYSAGHRRWILHPYRKVYGVGVAGTAMALHCFSCTDCNYPDSVMMRYEGVPVAWPPVDFVPAPLVYERWTFSLSEADFSKAKVKMTYKGKEVPLVQEEYQCCYGLSTVVWVPVLPVTGNADAEYTVTVSNIKRYVNGKEETFSYVYKVIVIHIL